MARRMSRNVILALALMLVVSGCFAADGRWRTFGPAGSGSDLRYGLLLVQQTSSEGRTQRCNFQFVTPGGEFVGALNVGNATLFNMTPPFDRVRLVSAGGASCLAIPVTEAQGRQLVFERKVGEVRNFQSMLRDECAVAHTWPDPQPGSSLNGIVTATGDALADCEKFGLLPR